MEVIRTHPREWREGKSHASKNLGNLLAEVVGFWLRLLAVLKSTTACQREIAVALWVFFRNNAISLASSLSIKARKPTPSICNAV
jgi:hypothetical protein